MRIVTVVDTYPCLSETFIDREVQELRRQGCDVEVAALRGDSRHRLRSRFAPRLWAAIARLHWRTPRRCLRLLRHAGQAADLAQRVGGREDTHLLAQFAWTPAEVARLAAERCASPFSVRVHAWDVFTPPPHALRQRLDGATVVVPCSRAAADAVRACGYPAARIHVVHHGLPLGEARWDWQPPKESREIVGIGRMVPKKGIAGLLDACARLHREGTRFSLTWIGDGPERERLAQRVRTLGLDDLVHFVGALPPDDTRERLRSAGLFVLPSQRQADGDRDGIANVLLEAMALGVPVVTTTAGAATELIEHGVQGLLAAPGNPEALADALQKGLDPATDRRALSRAARLAVECRFDLTRNVARLLEVLRSGGAS